MKVSVTKSQILITVILMDLLTGMEFDLFVPSFPQLQIQFNLTPFWVEALLSINFIGYCLSLFFVGSLSDRYGRKRLLLLGLLSFIFGSILCLCAESYWFLILGRFLQGVGIAAPSILSFLIIADMCSLKQQQFFMSILNGFMNVAVGASPVLGSYLTLYFHWRGNFTALLLLGIFVLGMVVFFIPSQPISKSSELESGEEIKQEESKEKIVGSYLKVFRSKPLMLVSVHIFLMCVPYWVFVGMSPLLYMKDCGVSLAHFGYYQGILALVFAFGSVLFGLIINKADSRRFLSINIGIFVLSFLLIGLVAMFYSHMPLFITLSLLIFVIGQIIPSSLLYPVAINFMPESKGRISGVIQGGKLIFSALSLQIAGYFYDGSFKNIGLIILVFVALSILTLVLVIRNRELMGVK